MGTVYVPRVVLIIRRYEMVKGNVPSLVVLVLISLLATTALLADPGKALHYKVEVADLAGRDEFSNGQGGLKFGYDPDAPPPMRALVEGPDGFGKGCFWSNVQGSLAGGPRNYSALRLSPKDIFGVADVRIADLAYLQYWTKNNDLSKIDWQLKIYTVSDVKWYGYRFNFSRPNNPDNEWHLSRTDSEMVVSDVHDKVQNKYIAVPGGGLIQDIIAQYGGESILFIDIIAGYGSKSPAVDSYLDGVELGLANGDVATIDLVAKKAKWNVPGDFETIQDAVDSDSVVSGDTIKLGHGTHFGAFLTKSLKIEGENHKSVIDDGPLHPAGLTFGFALKAGSGGSTISHVTFDNVDLAVSNRDAVDGVTIEHCTFLNPLQGVSNWSGSGWNIRHNEIEGLHTRNGGGIGILIADWAANPHGVHGTTVEHNKISGVLQVWEQDGGGYNGSGIVLYADFRWGRAGAQGIYDNVVQRNKVDMVSDNPGVVDIVAIELTDSRNDPLADPVIFDNEISGNKYECTALQLVLTPENLDEVNLIVDNRGKKKCK